MPSTVDKKTAEEDTQYPPHPQSSLSEQSTITQMSIHVYPAQQSLIKSKRHQVKNACTNCKTACKKCDDVRPCFRCVKYGISDNCVDSPRKPRLSAKRGPYKRKAKGNNVKQGDMQLKEPVQLAPAAPAIQPPHAEPWSMPYSCPPCGYPQLDMCNPYPSIPSQQAERVYVCMPVTQPHFVTSVPQFHPYVYPDPKYHVCPPESYYTAVFSSISYPEDGQLTGGIAHDQP